MRNYKVTYQGNASKFKGFSNSVLASSEREAVETVYQKVLDTNYFPQDDGSILDCDGNEIATPTDNIIEYDGGAFAAREI